MRREKLKTPEDYEIFSFRTTKEEKDSLNEAIEQVVKIYNKGIEKGVDRVIRKNDVIVEALEKGLDMMKRKKISKLP